MRKPDFLVGDTDSWKTKIFPVLQFFEKGFRFPENLSQS